jgi:membrane protein implicated in regulation of membrane protease activity
MVFKVLLVDNETLLPQFVLKSIHSQFCRCSGICLSLLFTKQYSQNQIKLIFMSTSIFSRPEMIWFIIGLVLFVLELVVPGFVIFFFGVGAWITALVCLIFNPNINLQIIIFAVISVLSLLALRKLIQKKFFYSKEGRSEAVEDEFTGKEAVATKDFGSDKKGKVEFKGTSWQAESESEIKAGQTVIIIEKENFKLFVEPKK